MRCTRQLVSVSLLALSLRPVSLLGCPFSEIHPKNPRPIAGARVDWSSCNCSDCPSGPTGYTGGVPDFREVEYNCTTQQCDDLGAVGFAYPIPSEYVPQAWECGEYDADLVVEAINEVLSGPTPGGPNWPCVGKSGVNILYAYNQHGSKWAASQAECPR